MTGPAEHDTGHDAEHGFGQDVEPTPSADIAVEIPGAIGTAEVLEIEVDRQQAVTITFADGLCAVLPLLELRRSCPCAGCRGRREQGGEVYAGDSITVVEADLHGNWALSIRWSDGHDTGMFAWTYLRALAEGFLPAGTPNPDA